MTAIPDISCVVPCRNEEQCVAEVVRRIRHMAAEQGLDYEIVFVEDGSTDRTLQELRRLRAEDERVRFLSFSRNFGHQVAVTAGLAHARGRCVAVMDCDLQDPPEVIGQMIAKWREGWEVVYAVRRTRQEGSLKQFCYKAFYYLMNKLSDIKVPRDAGDFCLLDAQVVSEMNRVQEFKPFVRGLRAWVGFSQTAVEYDRPARQAGVTNYTWLRLVQLAVDGFLSFTDVFLVWAAFLGFFIALASGGFGSWLLVNHALIQMGLRSPENVIPGWTSIVCLITFLMGLQFMYLGLLGKYIGRIFMQTKGRPLYIVRERQGLD